MQSARFLVPLLAALVVSASAPRRARAQLSELDAKRAQAKAQPTDPAASAALGRAYRRAGKTKESLEELRRGLGQTRAQAATIELHWELARTFLARSEFGQAMVQCKVIGTLPGGARAGHACAAEAHLSWRRASEALVESGLALAGEADKRGASLGTYEAKVAEATARDFEGKRKDAEAFFKEAIAWKPDRPEAHLALGQVLAREGERDGAVRELREATRLDPSDAEAAFALGSALGPTPEAVQLLLHAAHERMGYAAAEARLAEVELALGHLPEARRAADAAIRSDPNAAGPYLTVGRVALAQKDPDVALRAAESALKIVVNSAPAKLLVGDAQAAKGEIDQALEAYQAAHGLDGTDPAPLVHAADECRRAGRFTSARAFGMKATQDFPTWAPAWVAYGDALLADGQPADAKRAYEIARKSKGPIDAAALEKKISLVK